MKIAICHYSLHRRWSAGKWTLNQMTLEVKKLGLDAVDIHAGMTGSPAGADESIRAALTQSGLTLSGLSLSNNFSSDDLNEVHKQVETVKQWLEVAARVRAPVCRIFGGHLSGKQRGDPAVKQRKMRQIIDQLGVVAQDARKLGLILALENHGGLPSTGTEQVEVIRAINLPSLKATVDVGNYLPCGQESQEGTRVAAAHAAYVHFKDFRKIADPGNPQGWKFEACAIGEGAVNHKMCLEALREAGYNGYIALEYEGKEDEETAVPKSLAAMKQLMRGF